MLAEVFIFQTTFQHQGGYYILQTRKQEYYFDSAIGQFKVDFHPRKRNEIMLVCITFREHPSLFDRL